MADNDQTRRAGKDHLLDRRTYLKAASVTALAAVATSVGAAASDWETAFVIDAPESCSYAIEHDGTAERIATDAEVDDTLVDGRIEGSVTGGFSAYRMTGSVTSQQIEGAAALIHGEDAAQVLPESLPHTIAISSPSQVSYEFTTNGKIQKVLDDGKLSAEENNDDVTDNGDGTWTASGFTGNGFGDSFAFDGEIQSFDPMDGDFQVTLDGESVTPYDVLGVERGSTVVVESPTEVSFDFTSTGKIEKVLDGSSVAAEGGNDTVRQNSDGTWTASGFTGNGYGDSFTVVGDVTDFNPLTGDFTLTVDGTEVDPWELTGEAEPDTTVPGVLVGGGQGYERTVPRSQATTVVSTRSELGSALSGASAGDVVYVAGDARIEMGTTEMTVPSGVTLASNRGIDGASGGHINTTTDSWPMFSVQPGARVTGLRISGPYREYTPLSEGDAGMCLRSEGSGVEFDNNELFGFSHAAVRAIADTHVHHNHIHHNSLDGLGYGVSVTTGHPLIEYNRFNHNRHSVAGSGSGGYTVRYNHFGPETIDHVIDMHQPGGKTLRIHHNTVEAVSHVHNDERPECVAIRGAPDDVASIHHNWFFNPSEPPAEATTWSGDAIAQVHTDGWQNVEFNDNHYGSDEPDSNIGCPR